MHFVTVTILSLIFPATCVATLYEAFNHLPTSNFDFIIVGGVDAFFFSFCHGAHTEVDFDFAAGAAGSVIANRLTEDPSISVLLLEAGPSWVVLLPQLNPLVIDHISGLYQKHRCSRQYHSDVPCITQPQYAI
jgi:hypothetical protein